MGLRLDEQKRELQRKTDLKADSPQLNAKNNVKDIVDKAKPRSTTPQKDEINEEKDNMAKQDLPAPSLDHEYEDLSIRVSHLQCLYDFVRRELHGMIELRAKIAEGTLQSIVFEDLWHLVEPGDVIVSKDHGHDQLYKVYSVTGGQIRRRPRTSNDPLLGEIERVRYILPDSDEEPYDDVEKRLREEGSSVGTWTSFRVDCYMMAYDGTDIGPVEKCKKIKHYAGERRITELPLYPVRFHPEKERFLQKMEGRGRKFLSCTGHKTYEGMTLATRRDGSGEEIESDVYIDFVEYYRQYPERKPQIGTLLRSKQDLTEVEERFASGPDLHLNGHELRLSGHEVDQKLADDFMSNNRTFLERIKFREFNNSPDHLRLMPRLIPGYAFRLRRWCKSTLSLTTYVLFALLSSS